MNFFEIIHLDTYVKNKKKLIKIKTLNFKWSIYSNRLYNIFDRYLDILVLYREKKL